VPDILLTTLNARYAHTAFGLRYLLANLGPLAPRAAILEFDINQRPIDILESILAQNPKIVGIGVYIWNVTPATQIVADLKRLRPEITIILGGPEVSHETNEQEICRLADYIITGEADLAFAQLCDQLLTNRRPLMKIIPADLPDFQCKAATSGRVPSPEKSIKLPYSLYTDTDVAHRVIYVEASRGCPFKCEFCLSSLDVPLRNVPLDDFLNHLDQLMERGVNQFKFVDRTFNLNLNISKSILQFFHDRMRPGLFLHFEMIPDRLPDALRDIIRRFPPGMLQFEVGVQTFNDDVAHLISRRQDNEKLADNLTFLRDQTGVHVHADLIVGLPGEDMASFGRGFDRLVNLRPQEIQVGLLKRLRGTPITRHDHDWEMVYSPHPPYEVLQTKLINFAEMMRLRRFSRYWDLIANSGNFLQTTPKIWQENSPFQSFLKLSDWLFTTTKKTHTIALQTLAELIFQFLKEEGSDPQEIADTIWQDYQRGGRSDRPAFLAPYVSVADTRAHTQKQLPSRQARHLTDRRISDGSHKQSRAMSARTAATRPSSD
jgi:radical SAM superfamily enzyme YgiQ (UPF0313 family)